jgi:hypothetical protein
MHLRCRALFRRRDGLHSFNLICEWPRARREDHVQRRVISDAARRNSLLNGDPSRCVCTGKGVLQRRRGIQITWHLNRPQPLGIETPPRRGLENDRHQQLVSCAFRTERVENCGARAFDAVLAESLDRDHRRCTLASVSGVHREAVAGAFAGKRSTSTLYGNTSAVGASRHDERYVDWTDGHRPALREEPRHREARVAAQCVHRRGSRPPTRTPIEP